MNRMDVVTLSPCYLSCNLLANKIICYKTTEQTHMSVTLTAEILLFFEIRNRNRFALICESTSELWDVNIENYTV